MVHDLSLSALLPLYGFHVHIFFSIMFFMGVGLLYRWLSQVQQSRALLMRALWFLGIGAAGVLLTVPFCLAGIRLAAGI
jgi:hypothetical protein